MAESRTFMRKMGKLSLAVVLVFFSCASLFAADPQPSDIKPGMAPGEVKAALGGAPRKIARQIMYGHYHEVWYYDLPQPIWVEFDCRKGAEARVINVHAGIRTKP